MKAYRLFSSVLSRRIRVMLDAKRSRRTKASRLTVAACTLGVAVVLAAVGAEHQPDGAPAVKGQTTRSYEVSTPQSWGRYLSVGKFTVIGDPFLGIRDKFFGLCPVLRVRWPLENLSAEPLYLKVSYRGKNPTGPGGTGYGVGYVLAPHERRTIEDIVPVFSAKVAAPLKVYLVKLRTPKKDLSPAERHLGVTTVLLKATGPLTGDMAVGN